MLFCLVVEFVGNTGEKGFQADHELLNMVILQVADKILYIKFAQIPKFCQENRD